MAQTKAAAKKSIRPSQPDPNAPADAEVDQSPDDAPDTDDTAKEAPVVHSAGPTAMLENNDDQDDWPDNWADVPGAPKDDALILGPTEPLRVDAEEYDTANVRLLRPVYRAFRPMGSKRWGFILEYPMHHMMPKTMLVEAKQQADSAPKSEDDEDK